MALQTNNLFAPYRPGKNQTPQQFQQPKPSPYSAQATKGTAIPAKGSGSAVSPNTPPKTDAQKKQEIAVLDKKVQQGTKQLADAVKKQQKAKTPEEKKLARQEILKKAKEVMTFITQERNLRGELLFHYSPEEVEGANAVLAELETRRDALAKVVNNLKKKQSALLVEGWKGRWLGSIKTGKETEYNKIAKKIDELQPTLDELNTKVRNQSIIAGVQKFTKTRAFVGAAAGTVLTAAALYTWLGPVAMGMELNDFKSNPTEYIKKRSAQFANLTSGLLSSPTAKEAVTNAAGTALSETLTQSILRNFGQATVALVNEALAITKDITKGVIVQATIAPVVMATLAKLREQLEELLKNPDENKEQIKETSQEIITVAEKNGIKIPQKK